MSNMMLFNAEYTEIEGLLRRALDISQQVGAVLSPRAPQPVAWTMRHALLKALIESYENGSVPRYRYRVAQFAPRRPRAKAKRRSR